MIFSPLTISYLQRIMDSLSYSTHSSAPPHLFTFNSCSSVSHRLHLIKQKLFKQIGWTQNSLDNEPDFIYRKSSKKVFEKKKNIKKLKLKEMFMATK